MFESEILIEGDGLGAWGAAAILAQKGFRVTVAGGGNPPFASRVLALSWPSCELLKSFGLWDKSLEHDPIEAIWVGEKGRSEAKFFSREIFLPLWGFCVEYAPLLALFQKVARAFGAQEFGADKLFFEEKGGWVWAKDERGKTAALASLAICTRAPEKGVFLYSDPLLYFHCEAKRQDNTAFEHFSRDFSLVLLPQGEGYTCLLTLNKEKSLDILSMGQEDFLFWLSGIFPPSAPCPLRTSEKHLYHPCLFLGKRRQGKKILYLGDGWHRMHPALAQGFNLAIRDLRWLVGEGPPWKDVTSRFAQDRQKDVLLTAMTSHLGACAVAPRSFLSPLRSAGLEALLPFPFAWRFFLSRLSWGWE